MAATPIRIKSQWFKLGKAKSPEQQAGALGFTIWRVARQSLDRMREAGFDIDAGEPYFAFLREMLVFLITVADRLAHQQLDVEARVAFTSALVRHVAGTLQGNVLDLMGPPAADRPDPGDRFIELYNEVADHYAEFGGETGAAEFTPDFAALRYLGSRLEPVLPAKDRRWVIEQVMAAQAPDAVALVQRTMRELHSEAPRRARRGSLRGD